METRYIIERKRVVLAGTFFYQICSACWADSEISDLEKVDAVSIEEIKTDKENCHYCGL